VRVIVLRGNGPSFSAGADLNWMKRMATFSEQENFRDALALAHMLEALNFTKKPTVGLVQGNVFGGGNGLVACCDLAIADATAKFSLSEVRLGLLPATISPYVVQAMGARHARRYFVSGERFDAEEAKRIGLVHEVVPEGELDAAGEKAVKNLLVNGPQAMAESKDLVWLVQHEEIDDNLLRETAKRIAMVRATDEGKEGVAAFLEKRKPAWRED
jgi:methylglutaconyl-CoA hydratase